MMKLFSNKELAMIVTCPTCDGDGDVQYEVPRPQNFNRDVGEIDIISSECHHCDGNGEIEVDDVDFDD
jgi:DnaJ-class molecular chaperone